MSELGKMRELALRRTKAASAKIGRLKREGVNVAGSEFDTRKSAAQIKRMSRPQLRAYMGKVNAFTDRNLKFVAGAEGAPLPKHLVTAYTNAEKARNARLRVKGSRFDSVELPWAGMTVGQLHELNAAKEMNVLRSGGVRGFNMYAEHTRDPKGFPNAQALRELLADERRAGYGGNLKASLESQQINHAAWLEAKGQVGMAEKVLNMDADQFDLLRNHTQYDNSVKFLYFGSEDADESVASRMRDDNVAEAADILDWAAKYGEEGA